MTPPRRRDIRGARHGGRRVSQSLNAPYLAAHERFIVFLEEFGLIHYYFAYGSNLSLSQMARRCPGALVVGRAVLRDYRLVFPIASDDWAGGVAGVEPMAGSVVRGAIYQITQDHLVALDEYEAVDEGMYRRVRISVDRESGDSPLEVWTYLATRDPGGPFAPSLRYQAVILEGAKDHGLPEGYLVQLRRWFGEMG